MAQATWLSRLAQRSSWHHSLYARVHGIPLARPCALAFGRLNLALARTSLVLSRMCLELGTR